MKGGCDCQKGGSESYITVQAKIASKYIKQLNIKTVPERGALFKAIAELRKKYSKKTSAIEQLKELEIKLKDAKIEKELESLFKKNKK